jgi:nucleoside-diphosphate kinase
MTGKITLTMIKPDAMKAGNAGAVLNDIIKGGFNIIAMKYLHLSKARAEEFYAVHKGKPFYEDLTTFMSSGPIIAAILEKENAIEAYRDFIGKTNPADAAPGTIRAKFGSNIQENAVHGSDSDINAETEASFFFSKLERVL